MRILIVDDCRISLQILTMFLSEYGECHTSASGPAGLQAFRESLSSGQLYDLVSLDLSMPGMNGYDVLSAMREAEAAASIPEERRAKVIIVTAFANEEILLKAYEQCQAFLIKPVRKTKLTEQLAILGFFPKSPHSSSWQNETSSGGPGYASMVPLLRRADDGHIAFMIHSVLGIGEDDYEEANPAELPFFKNVLRGQMLARLGDPDISLRAGAGVHFNPENLFFSALHNGRVEFEGNELRINDTMILNDVFNGQHIDFLGRIEVRGSVHDGAFVRGLQGLKVDGDIGAARIESEGDIEVQRVNGGGKASIRAGGSCRAKFVHNANIESFGDVEIEVEAVHSIIKSSRNIIAGAVTGGECIAYESMTIRRAGSPKDVSTNLRIGFDFSILDRRAAAERSLKEIERQLSHLTQMIGPAYTEDVAKAMLLAEPRKTKIYEMTAERNRLLSEQVKIEKELSKLADAAAKKVEPRINIGEVLYKGVRLEVGGLEELVFENIKGPVTIAGNLLRL
ncbi:MAG: hypothetical protein A2X49_02240 [Lentisphaerae bacterium GWF2_52_8]|nr:MAG: hypothetical protein A2X49_02240 [Lentisphaerae bacterium GWF2_52_8]